jgi:hypothetical protein
VLGCPKIVLEKVSATVFLFNSFYNGFYTTSSIKEDCHVILVSVAAWIIKKEEKNVASEQSFFDFRGRIVLSFEPVRMLPAGPGWV